jgi:protein ImuB
MPMQVWLALLPPSTSPSVVDPGGHAQQQALGWWALQFTPRVALLEEAVVAELHASERLFGGAQALRARIGREASQLGCPRLAWSSNSLAALALARCNAQQACAESPPPATGPALARQLATLPLLSLSAVWAHEAMLSRLGCRNLGDVQALPRPGLARRFGHPLLTALDQAHGLQPSAHEWLILPDTFEARLELPGHVDNAPALLVGAQRLLAQMASWLAAHHAGITAFTLKWRGQALSIRTAQATGRIEHLSRLLAERLAQTTLLAPVDELILQADEMEPFQEGSASLLPQDQHQGENLQQLLERLSARLGADKVCAPQCRADHRPEHAQTWQAAQARDNRVPTVSWGTIPQPTWLLPAPKQLAQQGTRPVWQGPLSLLAGPYRMEGGWWDLQHPHAARDYFLAFHERAGLLWIFRERLSMKMQTPGWYLHGIFG